MITTARRARSPRTRPHAALPRLARQGHLRAGRLQLAPGRAAGGDPARAAAAPRRLGRRPPPRWPPLRGGRSRRARRRCRSRSPAPRPRGTCTSSPTRRSSASKRRSTAADIGHKAYYRTPVHRQAPMRRWAEGVELPATEQAAAHPSRDPDEPRAHARAGRRGRRCRALQRRSSASARAGPSSTGTSRTTRAGTPITTARGGTSLVTTAPAATNASSPISTPGVSTAPPPMRQARRSVAPRTGALGAVASHRVVVRRDRAGADEHVVLDRA